MKERTTWYSTRVERDVKLVRWGSFGTPVLLFPTAGGDAEEIERFHLVDAVAELLEAGASRSTPATASPDACCWRRRATPAGERTC